MLESLSPERALIFRITHRDNVADILAHGMLSRSEAERRGASYVDIGNPELIARRARRVVPVAPGGVLSDYVPFYFTPFSPMMLNIRTGYAGVPRRSNEEIVFFVSSLHTLRDLAIPFVFSDRHAYLRLAEFSSALEDLERIDWEGLRRRDFKRDATDKIERYQAEALVHRHVPVEALVGAVCYDDRTRDEVTAMADERSISLRVLTRRGWYFS